MLDAILVYHGLVVRVRNGALHSFVWLNLLVVVIENVLGLATVVLLRGKNVWVGLSLNLLLSKVKVFLSVVWILAHEILSVAVDTKFLKNLSKEVHSLILRHHV